MSLRSATILLLLIISITAACGHRSPATIQTNSSVSIAAEYAININTASLDELQRIPHIGEKLAGRIIEYRTVNGPFRRVEHLMLIDGISDTRFRKIRRLVRVE